MFARTSLNFRFNFTESDDLAIRMRGTTGSDISGSFAGIAGNSGTAYYGGTSFNAFNGSNGPFEGAPYVPFNSDQASFNGLSNVYFDKVRFSFKMDTMIGPVRFYVGPRIEVREIIDTNSFAGNAEADFANGIIIRNPLTTFFTYGSGGGLDWEAGRDVNVRFVYMGADAGRSGGTEETLKSGFGDGGLIGAENYFGGELEWRTGTAKLKLQIFNFGEQSGNQLPGATVLGNYLFANILGTGTAAYGLNGEWAITPNFGIFGRYGVSATSVFGVTPGTAVYPAAISTNYWSAGFSWSDFGGPGNTLGVAVGQPPQITGGYVDTSVVGIPDGIGTISLIPYGRELDFEIFYNFQINERISLTPDIQIITEPNNIQGNPTITVATLRAVFTF